MKKSTILKLALVILAAAFAALAVAATPVAGPRYCKVGATVTAGTFVKLTADNTIQPAVTASATVLGVAEATGTAGVGVNVAVPGTLSQVILGETVVDGDFLVPGPSGYAYRERANGVTPERIAAVATKGGVAGETVSCLVIAGRTGTRETLMTLATSTTLDATMSGNKYAVTASATITLPAVTGVITGCEYVFTNAGTANGAVQITVNPNSADKLFGCGGAGTTNHGLVNTLSTANVGDMMQISAGSSAGAGWPIKRLIGTWAAN